MGQEDERLSGQIKGNCFNGQSEDKHHFHRVRVDLGYFLKPENLAQGQGRMDFIFLEKLHFVTDQQFTSAVIVVNTRTL